MDSTSTNAYNCCFSYRRSHNRHWHNHGHRHHHWHHHHRGRHHDPLSRFLELLCWAVPCPRLFVLLLPLFIPDGRRPLPHRITNHPGNGNLLFWSLSSFSLPTLISGTRPSTLPSPNASNTPTTTTTTSPRVATVVDGKQGQPAWVGCSSQIRQDR